MWQISPLSVHVYKEQLVIKQYSHTHIEFDVHFDEELLISQKQLKFGTEIVDRLVSKQ